MINNKQRNLMGERGYQWRMKERERERGMKRTNIKLPRHCLIYFRSLILLFAESDPLPWKS